ncbi:MAG: DUF4350 domain-containing protein [Oscillochloridaceae bacterium umkhey_bin13]
MLRIMTVMLALVLTLALVVPVQAQSAVTISAQPAFEGNYLPGTWLPITVRVRNDGPDQNALLAASLPGAAFRNVQLLDLPGGAEKEVTIYAAMEGNARSVSLSLEAGSVILASQELEVRPRADERIFALLAGRELRLNLPRRQDLAGSPITDVVVDRADLPSRAAGLSSLALIMLYDLPTNQLSPAQAEALLGWVMAGGHLFIAGGNDLSATLASLPEQLVAASVAGSGQINAQPLADLAGEPGPDLLPGAILRPGPDARSFGTRDQPAWVQLAVGRGAVTVLAFDPATPAFANWPAAPLFWNAILRSPLVTNTPFGSHPGTDLIQENILAGALSALPTINLPPADLIFGLLAIYAIVVGPGVALLLRRRDRQAMAWLVVPGVALGVGAVVFGLALSLRADQRVVSQLSLVEALEGDQVRVRTLLGGLVPQEQILPTEGSATMLSRPVRGVSGQYGAVGSLGGDLVQDHPNLNLAFEAWRLQGVLAEQQQAWPGVTAAILTGPEGLQIELRNASDQTLREVVAVYGERIVVLGDLAPGTQRVEAWPAMPVGGVRRSGPLSYLVLRDQIEAARVPGQAPQRSDIAREALINAALTRGSAQDEGPVVLAWLDQPPLSLELREPGPARQATTLLVLRPKVTGQGLVVLPIGWLRPDLYADGRLPCFGGEGAGFAPNVLPLTIPMRLPPGMGGLEAEALVLTFDSAERWPNAGITTELYDWSRGVWVEQDFDGPGDLRVRDPAAYMQGGRLLVRFDGPLGSTRCIYASAAVRGTLP